MPDISLPVGPRLEAEDGLDQCFPQFSELMDRISGIQLPENKIGLVRSRLRSRLRVLNLDDFGQYLAFIQGPRGKDELSHMVDQLTTNKTSFFRESAHFDFMVDQILPQSTGEITIWCAGCSSGEEPYTLTMALAEALPKTALRKVRILATDLSTEVLTKAQEGRYPTKSIKGIPSNLGAKYFRPVPSEDGEELQQITDPLRDLVRFARLNLMRPWPMKGPFDMIWCRNVMIYFNARTREDLVQRFSALLPPGGHLFVGHSEGLNSLDHDLTYIQPAVYRK